MKRTILGIRNEPQVPCTTDAGRFRPQCRVACFLLFLLEEAGLHLAASCHLALGRRQIPEVWLTPG